MKKHLFGKYAVNTFVISGTDTGIGKTFVTTLLIRACQKLNKKANALKPISCGLEQYDGLYTNHDTYLYYRTNSDTMSINQINPYAYKLPISPHLASKNEGVSIDTGEVAHTIANNTPKSSECTFIEGAGGLLAPINDKETFIDLFKILNMPLIFIVGIKLGCINHALLSAQAIKQYGITCIGWYANCCEQDMLYQAENIRTIEIYFEKMLSAKLFGIVPYKPGKEYDIYTPFLSV